MLLLRISPELPGRSGDVVFVHGLNGDARLTWTCDSLENSDSPTRSGFWPSWLAEDCPDVGVWSLGYESAPSAWLGSALPLADRATGILDLLDAHHIGAIPLCFVAHSMGGLLVKQMLRVAETTARYRCFLVNTRGVIFLSTPSSGSVVATFATYLGFFLRPTTAVRELEAHNSYLRDLSIWYRNAVLNLNITNRVYFETLHTSGVMVVTPGSADPGISGVTPVAIEAADHLTICRPRARSALVYLQTRRMIEESFVRAPDILNQISALRRDLLSSKSVRDLRHLRHRGNALARTNPDNLEIRQLLDDIEDALMHEALQRTVPYLTGTTVAAKSIILADAATETLTRVPRRIIALAGIALAASGGVAYYARVRVVDSPQMAAIRNMSTFATMLSAREQEIRAEAERIAPGDLRGIARAEAELAAIREKRSDEPAAFRLHSALLSRTASVLGQFRDVATGAELEEARRQLAASNTSGAEMLLERAADRLAREEPKRAAEAAYSLGRLAADRAELQKANKYYQRATELNPSDSVYRGAAAETMRRLEESRPRQVPDPKGPSGAEGEGAEGKRGHAEIDPALMGLNESEYIITPIIEARSRMTELRCAIQNTGLVPVTVSVTWLRPYIRESLSGMRVVVAPGERKSVATHDRDLAGRACFVAIRTGRRDSLRVRLEEVGESGHLIRWTSPDPKIIQAARACWSLS